MASTNALQKQLVELRAEVHNVLKEVFHQVNIAVRAYKEERQPLDQQMASLKEEVIARFDGLDARIRRLEERE